MTGLFCLNSLRGMVQCVSRTQLKSNCSVAFHHFTFKLIVMNIQDAMSGTSSDKRRMKHETKSYHLVNIGGGVECFSKYYSNSDTDKIINCSEYFPEVRHIQLFQILITPYIPKNTRKYKATCNFVLLCWLFS